jgi:hypothetical protein
MASLAFMAALIASCGGQKEAAKPTTSATSTPSTSIRSTSAPSTTTTTQPLTVTVTPSPNPVSPGVPVTFIIRIRGPGTRSVEAIAFGDGGTTGANAGMVPCGETARADGTLAVSHSYTAPGTYQFSDQVGVIGPPPSCASEDVTATATVVVSSPLAAATSNGAFLSPSKNIACEINPASDYQVRCATFSPPQLVTMSATGSLTTCTGNQCELGNPAPDTPVLPYGTATGEGPYQCLSSVSGISCTVTSGKGFRISRSGIEPIAG